MEPSPGAQSNDASEPRAKVGAREVAARAQQPARLVKGWSTLRSYMKNDIFGWAHLQHRPSDEGALDFKGERDAEADELAEAANSTHRRSLVHCCS
eukprot:4452098-Pyramimonas_sp.AAC.1